MCLRQIICILALITPTSDAAFDTPCIETDYYRACVNADGSLSLFDKSSGSAILTDSPRFHFNYGATTTVGESVANGSFEIDANGDDIPEKWSLDKPYLRLSSERASSGGKSLKFDATAPASDHRRAWSPLMTASQGATYTISIDSYMSSYTTGWIQVIAYYYNTAEGTSSGIGSPYNFMYIPTQTGSWENSSFNWTPPQSAKAFRICIFMVASGVATVYLDNLSIAVSDAYTSNGSIEHNLAIDGDSTTITATDDSDAYVTVDHQYELNAHSPYIAYTANITYKQDVLTNEERFDFIVPGQAAQVMTRDLQLTGFDSSSIYWSDLYTPKVIRFANGLSFLGSDTMQSMRMQAFGSDTQVSFYTDYGANHPHFYYLKNGGNAVVHVNETRRSAGETCRASVTFAADTHDSLPYLIKARQPYGYDAAFTLTNHPDRETNARIKAVAYGTEDEADPDYGTRGIVGRGIGWTRAVFVSGTDDLYDDLEDPNFLALADRLHQDGVEIIGHTITPVTDSRSVVEAGLSVLSRYGARNWIDHKANYGKDNWEDLASQGAIKADDNYILDLLDQHNYQYAWSYIDLETYNYNLNMLKPTATVDIRPYLFYNNRVDDRIDDNKRIHLWSSVSTKKIPEVFYHNDRVDRLIAERGVHIGHEYLGYHKCEGHAWRTNNGVIEIHPVFDAHLQYLAQNRAEGLLWSPTVARMGDYLVPLKNVEVNYNPDGSVTVSNNSPVDVTGITLLAEHRIHSVAMGDYALVSFGGSYGDKEIVLPTIASGESIVLDITYGDKDGATPAIVSDNTGINRLNEITGYWDAASTMLIMTAEGRAGNYSFTVTMPAMAYRPVEVWDVTSDAAIGKYSASDTGSITFSASLDALHTFRISQADFHTVVPDVVGMTRASAESAITAADSLTANVDAVHSDTIAAGLVISQDPAGGTVAPIDSVVSIVVSLGPPITVLYVDNDAAGDPAPNDPSVSDPFEDGSRNHPFDMIQEAINASTDDLRIIVFEGVYNENINFAGRNIILSSDDPNDPNVVSNTVIHGSDADTVVTFVSGETPDCLLTGFTIRGGSAELGGGIHCFNSSPVISKCVITSNRAERGAGMYNCSGGPTLANCIFSGNRAVLHGGAIYNLDSGASGTAALVNCTLSGNSADSGGGIYTQSGSLLLTNSILWDNDDKGGKDRSAQIDVNDSVTLVNYSCVQGWTGDLGVIGNFDADPCFAELGYWDENATPMDVNDDVWVNGDYHLRSEGGRWDPNEKDWVRDPATSACIDAGHPGSDWRGELWPNGKRTNVGAYGGTPQAGMSLDDAGNISDLNHDGVVNFQDFGRLGSTWSIKEVLLAEDMDRTGGVDRLDLKILAENWLALDE